MRSNDDGACSAGDGDDVNSRCSDGSPRCDFGDKNMSARCGVERRVEGSERCGRGCPYGSENDRRRRRRLERLARSGFALQLHAASERIGRKGAAFLAESCPRTVSLRSMGSNRHADRSGLGSACARDVLRFFLKQNYITKN